MTRFKYIKCDTMYCGRVSWNPEIERKAKLFKHILKQLCFLPHQVMHDSYECDIFPNLTSLIWSGENPGICKDSDFKIDEIKTNLHKSAIRNKSERSD